MKTDKTDKHPGYCQALRFKRWLSAILVHFPGFQLHRAHARWHQRFQLRHSFACAHQRPKLLEVMLLLVHGPSFSCCNHRQKIAMTVNLQKAFQYWLAQIPHISLQHAFLSDSTKQH